jgi:hypothetical protein
MKQQKFTEPCEEVPAELGQQLHGLNINEALEKGLIDDLGDKEGNFMYELNGSKYAIVQGFCIQCSQKVMELSSEEIEDIVGDLVFYSFKVNGVSYFRLGMPYGIKLGKVLVKLNIEEDTPNQATDNAYRFVVFTPSAEPPQPAIRGMVYFDSTSNRLRCFDGKEWRVI